MDSVDAILNGTSLTQSTQSVDEILNGSPTPDLTQSSSSDPWTNFKQMASKIVTERGLPSAVLPVLLGQAAIESARGTSNFATQRNNYFGYEAYDSNPDNAKAYNSPQQSINDYLDLILSYPGVPEAIKSGNPDAIIRAIEANGYATDPNYVSKVESTPEFQGQ